MRRRKGSRLGDAVARAARRVAADVLKGADIALDIAIFDREGRLVGEAHAAGNHAAPPER